jgi:cytochrome c
VETTGPLPPDDASPREADEAPKHNGSILGEILMTLRSSLILAALVGGLAAPAFAQGDAEAGEKVFRKCKACHMVGEDAQNRVGPVLTGVVGRLVGSTEDFSYSDALQEKHDEGMVWDEESLSQYLADPKAYIPGNKMSFAGLRKEEDVADVISYLETFQ